jgi:pimeloyl-ACP methyl ester carboxylesterase
MLLVGTSDHIVGIESSKAIASAIPGAWLVQFKNGTQLLINEAPFEFAEVVLAFLNINGTVDVK